jgi:hypothetical protein
MTRFMEPTAEQEAIWDEWVADRPPVVRAILEKIDPWALYRLKSTDQIVHFYSCNEDGTITVDIESEHNPFMVIGRRVFGIDPDDLASIQ